MEDKKLSYSIMPDYVMRDSRLSSSAKVLFCKILGLSYTKGYCWATNSYFSEFFDTSLNSIKRWVKELEDNNYIKKEIIYDNESKQVVERKLYIVDTDLLCGIKNNTSAGNKNDLAPGIKNDPDNNIRYNNIDNNNWIKNDTSIKNDTTPTLVTSSSTQEEKQTIAEPTAEWTTPKSLDKSKDLPHNTENNPFVFLSDNDREYLRKKYNKCYIPTIKALNEWNKNNPEYRYAAGKDGFERFVQKQGLRRPREDGLSEGSVIARI